jgi:hypothetical protein
MREGRVSYEQARLIARAADDETAQAWIARAEQTTCIQLKRELEAQEESNRPSIRGLTPVSPRERGLS